MHEGAGRASSQHPSAGRGGPVRGSGRVTGLALGVSAALHVLALALYPIFAERLQPGGIDYLPPEVETTARGIRVVRLLELDVVPDPETPDDPEELEETTPPPVESDEPRVAEPVGRPVFTPPPVSPAERLRPRLRDRRLWAPIPPARRELTAEQRAELELAGRLEAWNDSVAAVEAAEAGARDWTVQDGSGGRWGISPGVLHLGDTSVPLPSFEMFAGARDDVADRVWQWNDIQRQGTQVQLRDSWKERARAIRARRDAERRAEQRPDTTRGGRRP